MSTRGQVVVCSDPPLEQWVAGLDREGRVPLPLAVRGDAALRRAWDRCDEPAPLVRLLACRKADFERAIAVEASLRFTVPADCRDVRVGRRVVAIEAVAEGIRWEEQLTGTDTGETVRTRLAKRVAAYALRRYFRCPTVAELAEAWERRA